MYLTPRMKAILNLVCNIVTAAGGAAIAAGIAKGDALTVFKDPAVLVGVAIAVAGTIRATLNDSPADHPSS